VVKSPRPPFLAASVRSFQRAESGGPACSGALLFDIPHTGLSDYDDIAEDQQMAANDILIDCELPRFGKLRTVNTPIQIEGADKVPPGPYPELGEHACELMLELGYTDGDVEALAERGAVELFRA
jgi:formyl-CoA transferase